MALTSEHLQTRLSQFQFEALFYQDLGWQKPGADRLETLASTVGVDVASGERLLVAEPGGRQGVILVRGAMQPGQGPHLWYPWLDLFLRFYADPLVICLDPQGERSLWCWQGGMVDSPCWRTRCIIKGQGDRDWAMRLLSLQGDGLSEPGQFQDCFNRFASSADPDLQTGFYQSWQSLVQSLQLIPRVEQREHYAMVLLGRLVAATALQAWGYLGGDEWYLHNQFGQSQQRGQDQFFQTVLQPLCQQGLTLPLEDRPRPLQQILGPLPFLPNGPFSPCPLDLQWGHISIPDAAFEPVLTWLGDWSMAADGDFLQPLLSLGEELVTGREDAALVTPEPILEALCDRTLSATLLDWARAIPPRCYLSLDHLLMAIDPSQAGELLEELGQLTVLDPACGSGRFLAAALQHLVYLAHTLKGIAQLGRPGTVPRWVQLGAPGNPPSSQDSASATLPIYRHVLTHCLYGVDLWPPAVELARLQLFLQMVQWASCPRDLVGLPDLTLTILPGNSLIGLIRVEDQRFEQVTARGKSSAKAPAAAGEKPLQGNLLQPLLANTYQGVLAERQVRLEHYLSQTQLLAEAGSVPTYAQADFLRDRIQELNQIAQDKLTHLLWKECSQQLGIRVQYQDAHGRRQHRLLELADAEALTPFHWGFYFHLLLERRGGFDVILSHFPLGPVQPTETEFVDRHQDLLRYKNVVPATFLRNRKRVLAIDGDLSQAWCDYRGTFSFPNQYFRRSNQYSHSSQTNRQGASGRLYWSRLFLERCLQLLRSGGRCGLVLDSFWAQANSAPLRQWLQTQARVGAVVDLSNHGKIWPALSSRTTLTVLWLQGGAPTQDFAYRGYNRAGTALTPEDLGPLLQSLIHLAE